MMIDSISNREALFSTRRTENQKSSAQRNRMPRLSRKRRSSLLELCSDSGEETEGSDYVPGSPALEEPNDENEFEPGPPLPDTDQHHDDQDQECVSGARMIRSDDDRNIDSPRSSVGDNKRLNASGSREGMVKKKSPSPTSGQKRTKKQQKKPKISKSLQTANAKQSNIAKKASKSPKDEKVVKRRKSIQKKKKSASSSKHRITNTKVSGHYRQPWWVCNQLCRQKIALTGVDDSVRDTVIQLENVLEGYESVVILQFNSPFPSNIIIIIICSFHFCWRIIPSFAQRWHQCGSWHYHPSRHRIIAIIVEFVSRMISILTCWRRWCLHREQ